MPTLLRLDASSRESDSYSRAIANKVEEQIVACSQAWTVNYRNLPQMDISAITEETITGFYTPKAMMSPSLHAATALSDDLITELKGADTLLISAPMYNFSVPSSLKAWIDQIVRVHETFSFDGSAFSGLVSVKRVVLALSYGAEGYIEGGDLAQMNFFEPYLLSLLRFLGMENIVVFRLEGTTTYSPEELELKKQALFSEITSMLEDN